MQAKSGNHEDINVGFKSTWDGYYRHGNELIRKKTGFEQTNFSIVIDAFDGKNFTGTVTDDSITGGMPGTGKIEGEIQENSLDFVKLMPQQVTIDRNGNRQITSQKHPPIYYSGTLSEDGYSITGKWKFTYKVAFLLGFIPFPYRPGKGTWQMRKKNARL